LSFDHPITRDYLITQSWNFSQNSTGYPLPKPHYLNKLFTCLALGAR
jgi:hypothetical protein